MNKTQSFRNISLVMILSLVLFTGLRFAWLHQFQEEPFTEVSGGYLDMSDASFEDGRIYSLSGTWLFDPNERVTEKSYSEMGETQFVPASWNQHFQNNENNYSGEGTYRLHLTLPDDLDAAIGLRFYEINSAAEIYANGEQIHSFNSLDHERDDRGMDYGPVDVTFHPGEDQELTLHVVVSNRALAQRGGLDRDILIGSEETMASVASISKGLQLSAGLILLLHAVYAIVLYLLPKQKKNPLLLLFGLMLLMFATGVFLDDEALLMFPVSLSDSLRMLLSLFVLTLYVMFLIVSVTVNLPKLVMKIASVFFISYASIIFFVPADYFSEFTNVTMLMFPVFSLTMITLTIRSILRGNQYAYFILVFLLAYTSNMVWGSMIKLNILQYPFYPADFIFSMMALMGLVIKQHTDITRENHRQANIIIENEANKDQFLANTAHELRNPLLGILTITDTILQQLDTKPKEAIRNELQLNRKIGDQMKFILDDLRDFTLLKESRIRLLPEPVDANATVRTIAEILSYQIAGKNVQIEVDTEKDLPMIYADQERFFQVIYNLLHNAVKFTDQGKIRVSVKRNGRAEFVQIIIADTGSGIASSDIERLMTPYEQGSNATMSGIGIGLNISKELTCLHGGHFQILSEEGQGTEIHLSWPVSTTTEKTVTPQTPKSQLHANSAEAKSLKQTDGNKCSLLLVDDDPVNLDLIANALNADYAVTLASDGETALSYLSEARFDLVISDVMMPDMSGYTLTEEIRKRYDLVTLPVLLLTPRYHAADIISGFEAGANDYVSKPVELSELQARVQTLTEMKHSAQKQIETEAALLQSQIRPHFLYNTLNAIASLSQKNPDRMVELLYEFGDYLKHSFRLPTTSGLVTLEEEMALIKPYLFIEQTRFEDRLTLSVDIADETTIHVPRLAIQTLMENAINHGALKSSAAGEVSLRAHRNEEGALITITDNGPGQADELRQLLSHQTNEQTKGIGLLNAHTRIKHLNGKGLVIDNRSGGGIIITVFLP
ncbi:ATP-binding protein [Salisediminibacterium selenitireducens]|uniref:histidine kinase n=1 Tax=Bacillus selenitireducens (strain ATCC 700615 / DSM 15326 / MLS10) TaxID=439292 RepID=D6XY68_BACIE|nr:ATP-binding protein [Salisediminibacterium selenitireducens]ADH98141.1 integral membrane sensor hybrid histidine kinase [[Bacillus] selenitireducens MLS10]